MKEVTINLQIIAESNSFSLEYNGFCCCQNFFLLFKYFNASSAVLRIIFWALSLRTPRLLCNSLGSLSNCVKYSYSGNANELTRYHMYNTENEEYLVIK